MFKTIKLKNILVIGIFFSVTILFSQHISAATFTVDSTGDEPDAVSGDGLCQTASATCTLRAAITAANNLAGADNIHFNIPTSDPGYRDYDDPNTPSSGDSVGGDDYWTIRPTTLIGYIFGTFDGATQETNSGFDRNIYGPDIEVDASGIPNPGPQDQAIIGLIGTNGVINNLVLNSYGYGAGIFSNANGVTITNNYIGTDVKGLVRKPSVTGVSLSSANNVVIGNNQDDGNIITATTYGIINQCANPNPNKISGNRIGLGADGVTAMPMVTGIFMHTNCNSIIGGDTEAERNYIASTTGYGVRFEGNLNATTAVHEVYNNYFGTDINGNILQSLEIKDAAIADVYGGDLIGYKTITIGAEGKGNLIANSRYGIRLNVPYSSVTVSSNTIVKSTYGILAYKFYSEDPDNDTSWYGDMNILNNYIGDYADPDPYFGLTFEAGDWTCDGCFDENYNSWYGISLGGFNGVIKGNKIIGNLLPAIYNDNYSGLSTNSVIGGQDILVGSLCQGLEKNCIEDNAVHPYDYSIGGGIIYYIAEPLNIDTIYEDNYFGSGNGYDLNTNVTSYTFALFDLLSGTTRRTDLVDYELTIPVPTNSKFYESYYGSSYDGVIGPTTEYTNIKLDCSDPLYCPESGTSSGEDGKAVGFRSKAGYEDVDPDDHPTAMPDMYSVVQEFNIDNSGNKIYTDQVRFDSDHFSSNLFSFDTDSTTHPQPYPGISEVWTDDPTATRADSFSKYYYSTDSGQKQVMKVQYVDANPIRQNDGSYIITVDSTTDEDNVSTCGFDDGYGDYSGGGCGGVDGLPDGKTSLREAMIVANQGITPLKIEFNIPTTDAGYIDYDDQNTANSGDSADGDDFFSIILTSSLPEMASFEDVTIDGASQEIRSENNRNTFGPDIQISGAGIVSHIFQTMTTESTKNLLNLTINGLIISNSTGNLIETGIDYGTAAGTESLIITDNYLCTDAKGLGLSSTCATSVVYSYSINGSIVITNNLFGWSNSGTNHPTIRVGAPVSTTNISITSNKIGTNPAATALTKAVDGYGIFVETNSANTDILVQDNIINTNQGTCFFGRNNLTFDSNYCGTDSTGNSIFTVSEIYTEGPVVVTNNVAARIITLEGTGTPVSVANNTIGINKNRSQKFDLTRFVNSGQTSPSVDDLAAFESWVEIGSFENNYISSTHNGVFVKDLTASNSLIIENNTFNDIEGNAIRMKDEVGLSINNNIFTNIATGNQVIELLVNNLEGLNVNDATDEDSFVDDVAANDGMNSPELQKITYIGASKYKVEGVLKNNVSGEAPFDLEICLSDSDQVNCTETVFYQADYIQQISGGLNTWEAEITIPSSDGSDIFSLSALATNSAGFTSEFGTNISTQDESYTIEDFPITLIAPTNNQVLAINKPLLQWQASTDPDLKHYNIYVNSAFYATVNKTESQLQVPTALTNGVYNWYVVGIRNNNTEGGRSTARSFTVTLTESAQTESTPTSYPTLVPISEIPSYTVNPTVIFENNILENTAVDTQKAEDKSFFEQIKETTDSISPVFPLILGIGLGIGTITTNGSSLMQIGLLFGFKNKRKKTGQEFDDSDSINNISNKFIKILAGMGFVYSIIVLLSNPIAINFIIAALYILVFGINIWISFRNRNDI